MVLLLPCNIPHHHLSGFKGRETAKQPVSQPRGYGRGFVNETAMLPESSISKTSKDEQRRAKTRSVAQAAATKASIGPPVRIIGLHCSCPNSHWSDPNVIPRSIFQNRNELDSGSLSSDLEGCTTSGLLRSCCVRVRRLIDPSRIAGCCL